jgi:glycerol-3-phosphate dehydrogenase (NAD(P)+)
MSSVRRVAVIGDGGWGTALALTLVENGHDVTLWGPFPEYATETSEKRENTLYLPGVELPEALTVTGDRASAVANAEMVVLAVPSKFYRKTVSTFKGLLNEDAHLVTVSKGFDPETHERLSVVASQELEHSPVSVLSGPSHAEEVARKVPTAVVVACDENARAREVSEIFMNSRFRVYVSDDVVGVELGGALKNVIALAAGVNDGIGFGTNASAALVTRGLAEITRLGCAMGAQQSTFAGLSGMGDLIVTCCSKLSRNHAVGERLGRGESIDEILGSMKQVAEGVSNCPLVRDLAHKHGIEVPITEEVYAIIHEGRDPHDAVEALMTRSLKSE